MSVLINASTSSGLVQTADTSGTLELQSNGTTQLTVSSTGAYGQIKSGTAVASTSGTSIDFTGLPSWVKRITVMLNAVSTNGTSNPMVQLGTLSGIESTGYTGAVNREVNTLGFSTGYILNFNTTAATTNASQIVISSFGSNLWVASFITARSDNGVSYGTGLKTLSGTLDRIRITTVNGTDAFDAGSINILYEG